MDHKARLDVLFQAIHTYGYPAQMRQCIEEMAELMQAICKYQRATSEEDKAKALDNFIEEIADVRIMAFQMEIIATSLLPKDEVNRIEEQIDYKILRLKERLRKHE